MSIIQPDVYSYKDTEKLIPYGIPLLSAGLVNIHAVDGFGLVTRGLLWEQSQIWFDLQFYAPLTTMWAASEANITTNWADASPSVSTSWSDVQFGVWGDYTPE